MNLDELENRVFLKTKVRGPLQTRQTTPQEHHSRKLQMSSPLHDIKSDIKANYWTGNAAFAV